MSGHPTREQLTEYAWETLPEDEGISVEAHVSGCAECALVAERTRAEARRLREALASSVPSALEARVLAGAQSAAPQSRPNPFVWTSAAAAALLAVTCGVLWTAQNDASRRIDGLQTELAKAKAAPDDGADQRAFLAALADSDVRQNIGEVMAYSEKLSPRGKASLEKELQDSGATTVAAYVDVQQGEMDIEQFLAHDTFPGFDAALASAMAEEDLSIATELLAHERTESAKRTARGLATELQAIAGLSDDQAAKVETYLAGVAAWRRDLPFMPDIARRAVVAHGLGTGAGLKDKAGELFNKDQAAAVVAFLGREAESRRRAWDGAKKGS